MSLRGVWHFSFTVSDLKRSIVFGCDILQLHLIHKQYRNSAHTRRLVGYPNARLRVARLGIPGEPIGPSRRILELVEYLGPRGNRGDAGICNPGAAHLLWLFDQKGGRFVSAPNLITAGINKRGYNCYFLTKARLFLNFSRQEKKWILMDWLWGQKRKTKAVIPCRGGGLRKEEFVGIAVVEKVVEEGGAGKGASLHLLRTPLKEDRGQAV